MKEGTFVEKTSHSHSLEDWISYLENLNPDKIELGLDRVKKVFDALLLKSLEDCTIVEVAGTNGKGSTAAFIAKVLGDSNVSYGLYTSPHLLDFKERIVINGKMVSTALLLEAFTLVKEAMDRCRVPLTYFEFTTLAAFVCFKKSHVTALVLEIGLGGRLDAVNVLKANIAVITSIDFDHMQYLGSTLLDIAKEKAGIIKDESTVVLGRVSKEVLDFFKERAFMLNATLYALDFDFGVSSKDGFIYYTNSDCSCVNISFPKPKIPENDALLAIKTLHLLRDYGFKITDTSISKFLPNFSLLGRMQCLKLYPRIFADVAHNPEAIRYLVKRLHDRYCKGRRFLVLGMLRDKDIESVITLLKDSFDGFYLCSLKGARGESYARLKKAFESLGKGALCQTFESLDMALDKVLLDTESDDEIIITGSFVTVANALKFFNIKYGENNV